MWFAHHAGKRCHEDFPQVRCYKTDQDLADFIAHLSHDDFPPDFSPWEILILPKCQADPDIDPEYAIVFRFHHVIADGVSLVRSFLNCIADEEIKTVERRSSRCADLKTGVTADEPITPVNEPPTISLPRGRVSLADLIKGYVFMPRMAANSFTRPDANGLFGQKMQGNSQNFLLHLDRKEEKTSRPILGNE